MAASADTHRFLCRDEGKPWMPACEAVIQSAFRCWTGADPLFGMRIVGRDRPHLSIVGSVVAPVARHVAPMFRRWHGRGSHCREAQPVSVQQVMRQRMQQADAAYRDQPIHQHPPEAAVLHLGVRMLGQPAAPVHQLGRLARHPRPPVLHRAGSFWRFHARLRNVSAVTSCRSVGGGL